MKKYAFWVNFKKPWEEHRNFWFYFWYWGTVAIHVIIHLYDLHDPFISMVSAVSIMVVFFVFGIKIELAWWKIAISCLSSAIPFGALLALPLYFANLPIGENSATNKKQMEKEQVQNIRQPINLVQDIEVPKELNARSHILLYEANKLKDNGQIGCPDWFNCVEGVDIASWNSFLVASAIFVAIWNIPSEYYSKINPVIQKSLLEEDDLTNEAFDECREFCYKYISNIPKEYNYDPLADLLAVWGRQKVFDKGFENIQELTTLRDTCSYIVNEFSCWWDM